MEKELLLMHIDNLNDRIEKLRDALSYYASEQHFRDSWIDDEMFKDPAYCEAPFQYLVDTGETARDALNSDDIKANDL